jgi:arginyl-tRNA synthetase
VLGNVLANVLKFSGHQVTKEYYLNDAGQKILNLVWTVRLLANSQPLWQDAYKGDYLLDFANKIKETRPELVSLKQKIEYVSENEFIPTSHVDDKELANICIKEMMNSIQETLKSLNVIMDSYVSEKSLLHKTQNIIELLKNKNEITSHENAVFFQTKDFLEKERVLQKSNGEYTYFANDIVYHLEKYNKNYDYLINVWGADHHGYVSRLKSAIKSLNQDPNKLEILLLQMVKFIKNGKSITFSKTEGNVITIDEILGEINESAHNPNAGRDALIYFLLSRSHDSQLDVDIDLLKTRSMDNPVFYAQMMHARMHQIIEKANNSTEFKIIKNFNELNRFSEYSFSIEEKEMLLLCADLSFQRNQELALNDHFLIEHMKALLVQTLA